MWYRYELEIPAGTTEALPERHEIGIPAGVIKGVRIRYPPGPAGLVSAAVFLGTHKMWPRGQRWRTSAPALDGVPVWWRGDGEWIAWEEHVVNIEGWHWFLEGYSPNATLPHTVFVDIFVLEAEFARPMDPIRDLVGTIKRLIGL